MKVCAKKYYNTEVIKKKLLAYRDREQELDNQAERLERLKTRMQNAGAQTLTGMPSAKNPVHDRAMDYIVKKTELEEAINENLRKQKQERHELENVIDKIDGANERAVIRMRYFDMASWYEVTDMIFGGRKDYLDKEESYLRRVHKLHKTALIEMARYIAGKQIEQAV